MKCFILIGLPALALILITLFQLAPANLLIEQVFPYAISDQTWATSIDTDPTAHGYSAFDVLPRRNSNLAINTSINLLSSNDPYIWLNAATYLGHFGKKESVPYLIKSLEHSAWRGKEERIFMLKKITEQDFGSDRDAWIKWYVDTHTTTITWDTYLNNS